jgi:hypothetical protein
VVLWMAGVRRRALPDGLSLGEVVIYGTMHDKVRWACMML